MAAVAVGLHFQDIRALAFPAPGDRFFTRRLDRTHVHAVDLLARNVERNTALGKIGLRGRAGHRRTHRVAVVLDDINDRKLPQLSHVEAFVDLALVGSAVAEIGDADEIIAAIAVGKSKAGAERNLRADDAMAAEEILLLAEHVHRAALAVGIATAAAGQLSHNALGVHSRGEHMPVITVTRYDLIALLERHLHADDDRFLADIEVTKTADRSHAVGRPGLLFKA